MYMYLCVKMYVCKEDMGPFVCIWGTLSYYWQTSLGGDNNPRFSVEGLDNCRLDVCFGVLCYRGS